MCAGWMTALHSPSMHMGGRSLAPRLYCPTYHSTCQGISQLCLDPASRRPSAPINARLMSVSRVTHLNQLTDCPRRSSSPAAFLPSLPSLPSSPSSPFSPSSPYQITMMLSVMIGCSLLLTGLMSRSSDFFDRKAFIHFWVNR